MAKTKKMMYRAGDSMRLETLEYDEGQVQAETDYRSGFRRDYARLLHAPCFRRLQGKMQLFPGAETDFFRNRLTHSLEVAQIAKTIALKLNASIAEPDLKIDPDVVETAALAHDLGHPPFGHTGEHALDDLMRKHGGFEGNAQTLRILARLEKRGEHRSPYQNGKDRRAGLNLTSRVLASVLKYDNKIPISHKKRKSPDKVEKGYYSSESEIVEEIKVNVCGDKAFTPFRTVECEIMDIADDIAYSTYDLEDALKGQIIVPQELWGATADKDLLDGIAKKIRDGKIDGLENVSAADVRVFLALIIEEFFGGAETEVDASAFETIAAHFKYSKMLALNGYYRTKLTSSLVKRFVEGISVKLNRTAPFASSIEVDLPVRASIEVLKHFTFLKVIMSPRLRVVNYRGRKIVSEIFDALIEDGGHELMPDDFRECFEMAPDDEPLRHRVVADFIAGMTDRYAVEFYSRLKSENPQTIFKPF